MKTPLARLAKALAAVSLEVRVDAARRAGIDPRLAHRARATLGRVNVRPFDGGAYISLCAAIGLDPVTGAAIGPQEFGPFVREQLACAEKIARFGAKLSIRAQARKFRIESTALCRIENGIQVSIDPTLALIKALGRHPFDFLQPKLFHGEHKLQHSENTKERVSA